MTCKAGRVLTAGTKLFAAVLDDTNCTTGAALSQIGGVVSVNGPNMTADVEETTELDPYEGTSTLPPNAEFWKEFKAALRDLGTVELSINYTRTTYSQVLTWFRRGNNVAFELRIPNGDVIAFVGFFTALGTATQEGQKPIMVSTSIKGSGAPTFTAGS